MVQGAKVKLCSFDGCERPLLAKGLCQSHYMQRRRGNDLTEITNAPTGRSNHPLYGRWTNMVRRVTDPNAVGWDNYGGRGITVCEEWRTWTLFLAWAVSHGYEPGLTLERIDNDKGYSPENCRWATMKEQQRNKRSNHLVTAFGETKTLVEWIEDERVSVNYPTLRMRLIKDWSVPWALIAPLKSKRAPKGS